MQGDKRDSREKDAKSLEGRKAQEEALQDGLLAEAFGACLEEQMSFIPPEREIARMHTFSDRFTAAMEELCRTNGKLKKREMARREFVFSFNRIAACVLLMLAVGGACMGVYLISEHGFPGAGPDSTGMTAESTGQASDMAEPEEEAASENSMAEQEAGSGTEAEGSAASEAEFMGGRIPRAEEQALPAGTEEIKTLVSSPVLDRDAEMVKVTIGNLSENPISYSTDMELQVYLGGAWYVVPEKGQRDGGQDAERVELEAGMAQDEEIWLSDYTLDYEAEKYRVVVYVDGMPFGSEFWFETLEEGLEEVLERALEEPEQ